MSKHQENKGINQTELRAVLIGRRHSGKTSVINTILETSKTETEGSTDEHVKKECFIDGMKVSLVETPGLWKTFNLYDLSNISKQQLKNCDEKSCQKTDKQENPIMEIRLNDIRHSLDEGFRRNAEEITKKIVKLCKDIMEECLSLDESSSLSCDLNFKNKSLEEMIIPPQKDNIPEPVKLLLEREFSRWESIIIDGVQESLQDIKSSFELTQAEKRQMSVDVVERWLQNYNHYVQHTIHKIQAPESGTR
ncbi:hypothetical protein Q8A67_021838 [Cirrhinus molitorella]|uniref:G domain-containing protein n=1 Tax=Cirrhinus molitorella TaxID=172907 RepID=A0AA88PBI6_9TELE|nr:hypothetical protein Q8A67_021838 [Cirrhinus molitorella]